jgi:hypothetical protein
MQGIKAIFLFILLAILDGFIQYNVLMLSRLGNHVVIRAYHHTFKVLS